MAHKEEERILRRISTAELERRWKAIRAAMKERKIDFLLMEQSTDYFGGYVKWFTDMPAVHQKLVLNIMDGLIGGYAGGPDFKPQYSWNYGALYFSTDPVAIDSLCVGVLDAERRGANVPPIGSAANHIATAARLGLGQNVRANIELSEVKP